MKLSHVRIAEVEVAFLLLQYQWGEYNTQHGIGALFHSKLVGETEKTWWAVSLFWYQLHSKVSLGSEIVGDANTELYLFVKRASGLYALLGDLANGLTFESEDHGGWKTFIVLFADEGGSC